MEDIASIESSLEGISKSVNLDVVRRMAMKHIEDFVCSFSDPQTFATALASAVPTALVQITEGARIPEAAHLRCRFYYLGLLLFLLLSWSFKCSWLNLMMTNVPYVYHMQFNSMAFMRKNGEICSDCAACAFICFHWSNAALHSFFYCCTLCIGFCCFTLQWCWDRKIRLYVKESFIHTQVLCSICSSPGNPPFTCTS